MVLILPLQCTMLQKLALEVTRPVAGVYDSYTSYSSILLPIFDRETVSAFFALIEGSIYEDTATKTTEKAVMCA